LVYDRKTTVNNLAKLAADLQAPDGQKWRATFAIELGSFVKS